MIDATLACLPPTCLTMSPHMFSAATTCTTRAPFVGSAGLLPQPAIRAARTPTTIKPETVFINGRLAGVDYGRHREAGGQTQPGWDPCGCRGAGGGWGRGGLPERGAESPRVGGAA